VLDQVVEESDRMWGGGKCFKRRGARLSGEGGDRRERTELLPGAEGWDGVLQKFSKKRDQGR